MPQLVLQSRRLRIRTYAEGMLSALAHDLELEPTSLDARATLDGEAFTVEIEVPVSSIRVSGVLKRGQVDPGGLKASDKSDIEDKMRKEVLDAASVVVRGAGTLATGPGEKTYDVEAQIGARRAKVGARVAVTSRDGTYEAKGRAELKLSTFGIKPVKGPLGAFRLKDKVEVLFELTLRPEG